MQNIRLNKDLRTGIERLLPKGAETSATIETPISRRAKRCAFCDRSRDRKLKACCISCGIRVCNDHSKFSVSGTVCEGDQSGDESD